MRTKTYNFDNLSRFLFTLCFIGTTLFSLQAKDEESEDPIVILSIRNDSTYFDYQEMLAVHHRKFHSASIRPVSVVPFKRGEAVKEEDKKSNDKKR